MEKTLLQTKQIKKSFGGLVVADGIDFSVSYNQTKCIIGPNGAGKTTFFNLLTGIIKPDEGTVIVDGDDVSEMKPFERQRKGLVRTFQAPTIFPELSVEGNILLAQRSNSTLFSLVGRLKANLTSREEVRIALEKINMVEFSQHEAGSLSHGQKKRVEMAMAIVQKPKVLLMDEPTAGMTVRETMEIAEFINVIKDEMSIVIVEHDMEFVREIADKISVLYRGNLVREGTLEELENDEFIQEIYLGSVEV